MKIPETILIKDFELFKKTMKIRNGEPPNNYTNPILFNNILINSEATLYSLENHNENNGFIILYKFFSTIQNLLNYLFCILYFLQK